MSEWPDTLAPADAMFFKGDPDPRTRGTGNLVYTLDSIPEWDRFLAVWDRASRLLPPLHKRVVKASRPGRLPEWRDDPNFDLLFHVRRMAVPAPGTLREVFDFAETDGMTLHDSARPLWQVTLLEGWTATALQSCRSSITPGWTATRISNWRCSSTKRLGMGIWGKPMPDFPVSARGSRRSLAPVVRGPLTAARRTRSFTAGLGRMARRTASDPRGVLAEGHELVASTRRILKPVAAKPSPILRGRIPRSRYDVVDFSFQDLRKATKSIGCTINDGYLAGVAGGLRRYHEHFGVDVNEIPIAMPMSTRADDDKGLGIRCRQPCSRHR